jgi:Mg2+ and Co2+ transporter CorA
MMNSIPLVDWGMGTIIIGVFVVVCIVLVLVVLNLMNSDKKKEE